MAAQEALSSLILILVLNEMIANKSTRLYLRHRFSLPREEQRVSTHSLSGKGDEAGGEVVAVYRTEEPCVVSRSAGCER